MSSSSYEIAPHVALLLHRGFKDDTGTHVLPLSAGALMNAVALEVPLSWFAALLPFRAAGEVLAMSAGLCGSRAPLLVAAGIEAVTIVARLLGLYATDLGRRSRFELQASAAGAPTATAPPKDKLA